jgi:hypothetical protein
LSLGGGEAAMGEFGGATQGGFRGKGRGVGRTAPELRNTYPFAK